MKRVTGTEPVFLIGIVIVMIVLVLVVAGVFSLYMPPNGVVFNDKCLSLCNGHAGARVQGDLCQCLDVSKEFSLTE